MLETVLKIEGLNKSFGKRKIIKDVSFEVYAGEVFGFLGPNGAGKTTTIKMIMGFLFPDSGTITVCGYDLKKDYEKAMSYVGGIVENPEMYSTFTGMTNLNMYARIHDGITQERINEVVAQVGMEKRINEKVKRYSLGMKQRVGLAQAMIHRPKLLILDEPTNGLDPAGIKELRDILKKLAHEENAAVFVSSHMLSEMELMCDRVAIIDKGVIIGEKTTSELLSDVSGAESYTIAVSDTEEAKRILESTSYKIVSDVTTEGKAGIVTIEAEHDKLNEVNRMLINGGVDIYTVTKVESSLEEAFISVTGGGKIIE